MRRHGNGCPYLLHNVRISGWMVYRQETNCHSGKHELYFRKTLVYAIITSSFTFLIMCMVWGRTISMLFDPHADFLNFGIPFILYEPKVSFIGWIVLMMLISPFLQLLTTIFSSYLALLSQLKK